MNTITTLRLTSASTRACTSSSSSISQRIASGIRCRYAHSYSNDHSRGSLSPSIQIGRRHQSTASATSTSDESPSPSPSISASDSASTPYHFFGWGTSENGTLPFQQGSSKQIQDHPKQVDLSTSFPALTSTNTNIKSITCGPTSTAVLLSNDTCYTFGSNKYGQLGHGHTAHITDPTLLDDRNENSNGDDSSEDALKSNEIAQVAMGTNFSAFIDVNGDLFTCGYNGSVLSEGIGALGHGITGDQEYLTKPTLVKSLIEDGCYASSVTVGDAHMTVLTTEGEVLTCGAGTYGRCGNVEPVDQYYLEPVELLSAESNICQIASGKAFTMALNGKDGVVLSWGQNDKGQCGSGAGLAVDMYAMETMPIVVEGMLEGRNVVKIAAGHSHAAAVTDVGELYTWGSSKAFLPELATTLLHTKIVDVACGQDYTLALDEEGRIYASGKGKTGVLGLASVKKTEEFVLVEGMLGYRVAQIAAGWNHVAVLATKEEEEESE